MLFSVLDSYSDVIFSKFSNFLGEKLVRMFFFSLEKDILYIVKLFKISKDGFFLNINSRRKNLQCRAKFHYSQRRSDYPRTTTRTVPST